MGDQVASTHMHGDLTHIWQQANRGEWEFGARTVLEEQVLLTPSPQSFQGQMANHVSSDVSVTFPLEISGGAVGHFCLCSIPARFSGPPKYS